MEKARRERRGGEERETEGTQASKQASKVLAGEKENCNLDLMSSQGIPTIEFIHSTFEFPISPDLPPIPLAWLRKCNLQQTEQEKKKIKNERKKMDG